MILGKYLMMLPAAAAGGGSVLDDYSWALRLEADDLTLSDTDPVGTWADTSGNSNNATQSAAGEKPLFRTSIFGSEPAVRFDGINDALDFAGFAQTANMHVYLVLDTVSLGTSYRILMNTSGGTSPRMYAGYIFGNYKPMIYEGAVKAASSAAYQTKYVIEYILTSTTTEVKVDDVSKGTGASSGVRSNWVSIGNTAPASAQHPAVDIATILVSPGAVSTGDSTIIVDFLKTKYGI